MQRLLNPCNYSFNDLLKAANSSVKLKGLSQANLNREIKKLCDTAGWYYQDIVGSDGITYTSFSPQKNEK